MNASTRQLGPGGAYVERYALGTMTFGVETDEATAHRQMDIFAESGGNLIDTADVYADGESERIVGRWLANRTSVDGYIVATKGRFNPAPGSPGTSRRSIVRAVEASLERLGLEQIDLYFVHGWDQATPVEETLDALSVLVRQGKIHQIGWSNTTGWQLQRILTTARLGGYVVPTVFQPQYNLLDRTIEWDLLPCCIEEDVALTPWSPLGGGWLTGKYSRDTMPTGASRLGEDPNRGVEAYSTRNNPRTWTVIDAAQRVADRHGVEMAHVALAWVAARPNVSSVLLGARTVAQLEANLLASDLSLSSDDLQELNTASAPGLPEYPYAMVEKFCDVPYWRQLSCH